MQSFPIGILNFPIALILLSLFWIAFNTAVTLWFRAKDLKRQIKEREKWQNFHMASNRKPSVSTAGLLNKSSLTKDHNSTPA